MSSSVRFLIVALAVVLTPVPCLASRACNALEKAAGDAKLLEIQADATRSQELVDLHLPFGVPVSTGAPIGEQLLVQGGYIAGYDADLLTTLWTGHRLTQDDLDGAAGQDRVNCFREDLRIVGGPAPSDYDESIFDQGHMTNDADLKDDLTEQVNTYPMTNMSPQHCRLNRGIWLSLEDLGRELAAEHDTLFIMTGAIFDRDDDGARDADASAVRMDSRNGLSRVAVPSHYYMVFVRQEADGARSLSFLLPHTNDFHGRKWEDVKPHAVDAISTLEEIEVQAGLRLHPNLDRAALTQSSDGTGWDLTGVGSNLSPGDTNRCVTSVGAAPLVPLECAMEDECCQICRKSQACGDSCISVDRTCHTEAGCACDLEKICR